MSIFGHKHDTPPVVIGEQAAAQLSTPSLCPLSDSSKVFLLLATQAYNAEARAANRMYRNGRHTQIQASTSILSPIRACLPTARLPLGEVSPLFPRTQEDLYKLSLEHMQQLAADYGVHLSVYTNIGSEVTQPAAFEQLWFYFRGEFEPHA